MTTTTLQAYDVDTEVLGDFFVRLGKSIEDGKVPVDELITTVDVEADDSVLGVVELAYYLTSPTIDPHLAVKRKAEGSND